MHFTAFTKPHDTRVSTPEPQLMPQFCNYHPWSQRQPKHSEETRKALSKGCKETNPSPVSGTQGSPSISREWVKQLGAEAAWAQPPVPVLAFGQSGHQPDGQGLAVSWEIKYHSVYTHSQHNEPFSSPWKKGEMEKIKKVKRFFHFKTWHEILTFDKTIK